MKNLSCYRAGEPASWAHSCDDLCFAPFCYFFWLTTPTYFSSAEHSRGERVRLDLKDLDHFSLFPGQVSAYSFNAIYIIYRIKLTQS